ncbi:MAG: PAS domain-containing protein, partial [Minisyncoccota bacterium]
IILCVQTILFWFITFILYQKKSKITLIPLYAYIAVLAVFTHNLSDLGFAITIDNWYFLISSFSFFTTLMFTTLFLYLFEGPRAGRLALWTILASSFFYIGIVYLLGFEANTAGWVQFNLTRALYYFWSIFAVILDVIFLATVWELLSRVRSLNLVSRVFIVMFGVFALDTVVFTTGVFWSSDIYSVILKGNLLIRLILSLIGAPIMAYLLKFGGFSEEKRNKPKIFWEILNFRSDLETKILTLEEMIKKYEVLEKKLRESEETYKLAINGTGAGIWDWDVVTNKIIWSPKFCMLLGYEPGEIKGDQDAFKAILHPEDLQRTLDLIKQCFKDGKPFEIEFRLKTKSGQYRWFVSTGITKYDDNKK